MEEYSDANNLDALLHMRNNNADDELEDFEDDLEIDEDDVEE